jgi:hypothetical protein
MIPVGNLSGWWADSFDQLTQIQLNFVFSDE